MAERALATAFVNIVPGTKEMETYLKSGLSGQGAAAGANLATGMSGGFGSKLKSSFMPILGSLGVAFGAVGVANFARDLYTSAVEGQKADAVLSNITSSMGLFGNSTDTVVKRLQDFATEQMKMTGVDDDVIKGAQSKLMTFSEVAKTADDMGGAFDRATTLSADLAAAGFGSMDSASVMLGKALQNPIKGVTALQRVGVSLSDAQKKQVEDFMKVNDVAGAQKIILDEVARQVGGTAEAAATSGEIMKARWGDAVQSLGTTLMPVFEGIVAVISDTFVPAMENAAGGVKWMQENAAIATPILAGLGAAILTALAPAIWGAVTAVWAFTTALLANPLTWIVIGVGLLIAAIVALAMNWDSVVKWVSSVWKGFTSWIDSSLKSIGSWWNSTWSGVIGFFRDTWNNIVNAGKDAWKNLNDGVRDAIGNVVDFFKELPEKIKGAFVTAGTWLLSVGKNIIDGLMNGLKSAWNGVMDWARNIANGLSDTFKKVLGIKSPSRVFKSHGENIGIGLVDGMDSMQGAVEKSARELGSYANKGFEMSLKELTAAGGVGVLAGSKFFKATDASQIAAMLGQGGVLDVNGVTMADLKAAISSDAAGNEKLAKGAKKSGQSYYANPALMALLEKAGYSMKEWSVLKEGEMLQDLTNRLQGGFSTNYTAANGRAMSTGSTPIMELTSEALNSANNPLLAGTKFDAISKASIETFIAKQQATLTEAAAWGGSNSVLSPEYLATVKADLAKAQKLIAPVVKAVPKAAKKIPKLATGGFVNKPTQAIIGEAGPEVVTPLKDFERMFFGSSRKADEGMMHITYNAAPNQSLDAEQALFRAMKRAKVVSGW